MNVNRSKSGARTRLVIVFLLFATPMIAAYLLYYLGWRPETVNPHGQLVTPARPVENIGLLSLDGKPVEFRELRTHWLLIYFNRAECTAACENALLVMRQTIAGLGREAHRAKGVMIAEQPARDWLKYQLKDYPGITVLTGPTQNLARLAKVFETSYASDPRDNPLGNPLAGTNRLYIVDPLGNFLMSFPLDADPSGLRKDLARLLRLSQVG
jgi:cytochrome oxidase Cu insertion factor (SCO1/SenC/PrrC family)